MAGPVIKNIIKNKGKDVLDEAQKIIDASKKGTPNTKAEDLLQTPDPKKVRIKDKELKVNPDAETVTTIKKKDFKVEPPKVADEISDDFLKQRGLDVFDNKIATSILRDFNINNIQSEADILKLIDDISKRFSKEFDLQKRGVKTNKVTKQVATLLNKNPEDLTARLLQLKPGSTLNAETILAARELLVAGMNKLDVLAEKASKELPDAKDVLEFRQHFALMSQLQMVIKGVQTETARALQQFRIKARSTNINVNLENLNAQNLLVELGGVEQSSGLAQLYLKTKDASQALKFTEETGVFANLTKVSDAIAESFVNVILSNPMTFVRNTGGNFIAQGMVAFERKLAANGFAGKGGKNSADAVAVYEDIAKAYGKSQAFSEIISEFGAAFRERRLPEIVSDITGSKVETRANAFSNDNFKFDNKALGTLTNITGQIFTLGRYPTQFINFQDVISKNLEYRSELYALAYRETMKRIEAGTLTLENAPSFLADRVINPTKDVVKQAYDAAHYVTFQTKLSDKSNSNRLRQLGNSVQSIKGNSGPFSWFTNYYLPFVRTPTNIASFTLERTPGFNLLLKNYREDLAAGGARRQLAIAKMELGAAFYSVFGLMGGYGYGSGTDPEFNIKGKADNLRLNNYQPKSLRIPIGDKVHQINTTGFDPLSMMIGQAMDFGQLITMAANDHERSQDLANFALALTLSFGENLSNSTFMAGVGQFIDDVKYLDYSLKNDTEDKFIQNWFAQYASSFKPTVVNQVGKFFNDNNQKLATEFGEYLKRNVAEADLNKRYDILGDEIAKFGVYSQIKTDPVRDELKRLNVSIDPFPRSISVNPFENDTNQIFAKSSASVTLNSEEQSYYQYLAGNNLKNGGFDVATQRPTPPLEQVLKSDLYLNGTEYEKEQIVKFYINKSRSFAEKQLLAETEIKNRITEEAKNKLMEKIITEQKGLDFPGSQTTP